MPGITAVISSKNRNYVLFNLSKYFCETNKYTKICPSSVKKYGLTVLMAQDAELRKYLDEVLKQMRLWIEDSKLNQVVLVVKGTRSQKKLLLLIFRNEKFKLIGPKWLMLNLRICIFCCIFI